MKISIYQLKKKAENEATAIKLYKQGLTTRQVGQIIGKSHAWVAYLMAKKLSTKDKV